MADKAYTKERRKAGIVLGSLRNQLGLTQQQLLAASEIDMGYTMLSRTECGERTPDDMQIIQYITALDKTDHAAVKATLMADDGFLLKAVRHCIDERTTELRSLYGPESEEELEYLEWLKKLTA